jgi:mannose-1-phosphate guanylyltransferase
MTTTFEPPCSELQNEPDVPGAMWPDPWAVLLAGGDGIRLRDLTRRISGDSRPKQFCPIIGCESLFRQTQARLEALFPRDRQVFVLSRAHEPYYGEDLADAGDSCVIEQPLNRGTGIAIVLAIVHVLLRDPDAIAAFFPCDHYYANDESFRSTIRLAVACANRHPDAIILVGAEAEYAEVEYGWIEPGPAVSQGAADGALFQVHRFWEKPPLLQARALLNSGCLWNTFVTVGRAATFLEVLRSEFPEVVRAITRALGDSNLESAYRCLPAMDFSRDVLAHQAHRLLVLRDRASGWADLGSQDRVFATLARKGIQPKWISYPGRDLSASPTPL